MESFEDDGPEHHRFIVTRQTSRRLDTYLQDHLKKISRNKVQQLIKAGGVTVNGRVSKSSASLRVGDEIHVILPPSPARDLKPEPIPLDILHEEEGFIVLNKQDDLIVHPARSHLSGTVLNALAHHFQQSRPPRPGSPEPRGGTDRLSSVGSRDCRPGVIHRLDRHTTGVLVVAKDDEDHWRIARQFEDRTILKAYLAVVHGNPESVGGAIDEPLGKHPTIREAQAVRHDSTARDSVTLFRVRERYEGYSLLELELKTGRTHQIRVHLSYIGHPIVGDILYGGEPIGEDDVQRPPIAAGARRFLTFARTKVEGERLERDAAARPDLIIARPALHAALLQMTHPRTQERITFTAPLHEPLATLVRTLRKRPIEGPVATEGYWVNLEEVLGVR